MVTVTIVATYRLYDATGKFFLALNTEIDIVPVCEICAPCTLRKMIEMAKAPRPFSQLESIRISFS